MTATIVESFLDTENTEPYSFYERVREQGNVVWDPRMKAYLVVGNDAARQVLQDDALFMHPFSTMQAGSAYARIRGENPRSFFFLHGEKHREMHRWWVRDLLSPQWVSRYRPTAVEPAIQALLAQLEGRAEFDLVQDYIVHLPVRVFARLLDLPRKDEAFLTQLKRLNDDIAAFASLASALKLEGEVSEETKALTDRAVQAAQELDEILRPIVRERRGSAGEDMISRLWAGGPAIFPDWNEVDTLDACRRLLFAGIDTTTHALANALHMLLTDDALMQKVRDGGRPAVERFVEEALRLNGTVQFRSRRVTADTELAGVKIAKGDMVVVILMAANRDPQAFGCPHAVDMERKQPRNHLAFLTGPRTCPGATLARTELVEGIQELLERFPLLRLAPGERPAFHGFMMRSYGPLHVQAGD
ncbi:cytochrome P450 [Xenophilus azovorans]|uniref:cytochrome P450 n=1 Tax=Xenophilus azovorans TaxID=151755 RepID=UPI0006893371|nr:cytochrome P450 [Xenophilus azovorans]